MKVKIIWFFVFIVLLVNITPIESTRIGGAGLRKKPSIWTRRYFKNRRYGSGTKYANYIPPEAMETTGDKWVQPLAPVSRDLMENPKRLKYLAENKNGGKSNIGRALTKS